MIGDVEEFSVSARSHAKARCQLAPESAIIDVFATAMLGILGKVLVRAFMSRIDHPRPAPRDPLAVYLVSLWSSKGSR